jgi:hypothetical protein
VERQKNDVPANRSRSQRWNDWTQSSFPRLHRALREWLGRDVWEISNAKASRCLLQLLSELRLLTRAVKVWLTRPVDTGGIGTKL